MFARPLSSTSASHEWMKRCARFPTAHGAMRSISLTPSFFAGLGVFDHVVFTAGEILQLGPITDTDIATAQRFFAPRCQITES
jgi:hypothetical protein